MVQNRRDHAEQGGEDAQEARVCLLEVQVRNHHPWGNKANGDRALTAWLNCRRQGKSTVRYTRRDAKGDIAVATTRKPARTNPDRAKRGLPYKTDAGKKRWRVVARRKYVHARIYAAVFRTTKMRKQTQTRGSYPTENKNGNHQETATLQPESLRQTQHTWQQVHRK